MWAARPRTRSASPAPFRGKHGFNGTDVFLLGSRAEPPATSPGYRPVSGTITYTFADGSTLTALETAIGNVDTSTDNVGHAGGTQEFTGGTGRYEGATGFTYLNQHFEDEPVRHRDRGRGLRRGELGSASDGGDRLPGAPGLQLCRAWMGRTSTGSVAARLSPAAHSSAESKSGASTIMNPPICSLPSAYGPSVVRTSSAPARTTAASFGGCRPPEKTQAPASLASCSSASRSFPSGPSSSVLATGQAGRWLSAPPTWT